MLSKNKIRGIVAVVLVIIISLLGWYGYGKAYPIYINNQPVSQSEMLIFMRRHRAEVTAEFKTANSSDSDFWHSSANGVNPYDALLKKATQSLVRAKAIQLWAVEEGVISKSSYPDNLDEWQNHPNTEILAGLDSSSLYFYYQDQLELALQQKLAASTADLKAVEEYYSANPQYLLGSIECEVVVLENNNIISTSTILIDDSNYRGVSESNETLANHVLALNLGETVEWIDQYGQTLRLTCTARVQSEVIPLEDVLEATHGSYTASIFESQLEQRILNITVKTHPAINSLSI